MKTVRAVLFVLVFAVAVPASLTAAAARDGAGVKISNAISQDAAARLAADDMMGALSLYESALVANPRNTRAYVGLGRTYDALGRPQDSMRYYGLALDIDPNDINALEAQSLAYIETGDIASAQDNLNRLRRICVSGCAALERVDSAIAKALAGDADKPAAEARDAEARNTAEKG